MTHVWIVSELTFDGPVLQGVYASLDAVRRSFPHLEWRDTSYDGHQEWTASREPTNEQPWGEDFEAALHMVIA